MSIVALLSSKNSIAAAPSRPDGLDTPPPPKIVDLRRDPPGRPRAPGRARRYRRCRRHRRPRPAGSGRRADALIVRSETHVTPEVFAAAPHLRVVARAGVGVDNIDLDAATRAGVLVLNAPGANRISAGEHTVALLLAVTRQILFANESTHAGRWERKKIKPIDLRGRTVGIVGLGRVGSVVAPALKAFEMNLIAYDPYMTEDRFAELGVARSTTTNCCAKPTSSPTTFRRTAETHHMLNAERIEPSNPPRSSSTAPAVRWSTRSRWPKPSARPHRSAPGSTSSRTSPAPKAPSSVCRTSSSPRTPAVRAPRRWPTSAR